MTSLYILHLALFLRVQLGKEEKAGSFSWSATVNVDLAAPHDKYDFNGNFKAVLDSNSYGQGQLGKSITITSDYVVGEDKRSRSLSLDAGSSDSEKRLNGKLCITKDDCFDLQSKVKKGRLEKSCQFSFKTSKEFAATSSASLTLSEDRQTRLTSFQFSLKDPASKLSKEGGIKLYKKPGTVNDLELTKSDVGFQNCEILKHLKKLIF